MLHKSKVLISIVDDDKAARESLQDLVRSLGYSIISFSAAKEFLASALLHHTTCLISDVQMPGMSGLELQAKLIAMEFYIPAIFITGQPNEAVRVRALEAGAIGFLTKPIDQNDLLACLARAFIPTPVELLAAHA